MIKVCHISSAHNTYDTRILLKECSTLASNGYYVSLVIPGLKDEYFQGVHIKAIKKYDKRLLRMTLTVFFAFIRAIKTRSKIYHFHDPELFFVGVVLKLLGKKVIFDVHENISAQIKRKNWLPFKRIVSFLFNGIDFLSAKLFYLILAENSYKEVYEKYHPNYEIVLNLPDISFLDQYVIEDRSTIENGLFYVGGVTFDRGIESVINALIILKLKQYNFVFHCVGPIEDETLEKIHKLNNFNLVKEDIIFYNSLKLSEAFEISKKCKLGLSILKPIENYKYSYSTKIFEYMSVQLPVITSNFELYKNIIEKFECGICVDPLDSKEIASAIELIINQSDLAKKFGENGKITANTNFNWKVEEAKLLLFYSKICATI